MKKGSTRMYIDMMPPQLKDKMVELDVDNDGYVEAGELAHAVDLLVSERKRANMYLKGVLGLFLFCFLMLGAITGLTFAVVELSKDTKSSNGFLADKDSGAVLKTETHERSVAITLEPLNESGRRMLMEVLGGAKQHAARRGA